jgi:hypothetical protein
MCVTVAAVVIYTRRPVGEGRVGKGEEEEESVRTCVRETRLRAAARVVTDSRAYARRQTDS